MNGRARLGSPPIAYGIVAAPFLAAALAGCLAPSGAGTDGPLPACAEPCRVVISTGYRHFEPTVAIDPKDRNHLVAASRMFLADDLPANS